MTLQLQTIICSTRPGRIGPTVARWFDDFARKHGSFDCQLVDLADFKLPVYDEANHPRLQHYENEHTQRWSRSVATADAYAFVVPEYNYCPPPAFFNALNFVYNEWNYKPCGFVSYGGVSGGLRSAQLAKQLVTTLKMMPIPEGVMVQFPWDHLVEGDVDGEKQFQAATHHESSAGSLLGELARWAAALKPMRG